MRNKILYSCLLFLSNLIVVAQISGQSSQTTLLQDATQAMTTGKLSRAESDLQSVLKAAPEDYRALDLLGVVRVLQKRETEADELFHRAVQNKSDFAPAHAHLGLLYAEKGRAEEAVPQLHEALRLDPARRDAADALVPILQSQAKVAAESGDFQKALALLSDAVKYTSDNPDIQFELGTIELQMSLWEDAIAAFQRTLKLRANDPLALYNLGRAFLGEWKFEDARAQFASYVALRPDDASGHCALGMTLAALERMEEAVEQFERAIALDPGQTEPYFRLGLVELNSKDFDKAGKNFRQVLSRDPKHAGALSALGRISFEQKRYPEAIDVLQRAITIDDSLREAHYYLGLTFARLGRKEEADYQLQIATRLEHDEAQHRRIVFQIEDGITIDPHGQQPKK